MDYSLPVISWLDIGIVFLPMVIVFAVMFSWSLQAWTAVYSTARMLIQLILIGYFLVYIFGAGEAWVICLVLAVMLTVASWISLNPVQGKRRYLYPYVLISLASGGGLVLFLVVWGVLHIEPWYTPQYTVPLAGMIFANSMNTVSLAAERYESEIINGLSCEAAKKVAFQTGMIPRGELDVCSGPGSAAGHDDGSDFIRCFTADSRSLSDRCDVHAVCCIRHLCSPLSRVDQS